MFQRRLFPSGIVNSYQTANLRFYYASCPSKGIMMNFISVSSVSNAGALIRDTVQESYQLLSYHIVGWFLRRGGKPGNVTRRKTSRSRVENQQTQPKYGAGSVNQTQATLVGGECSHHCMCYPKAGFSTDL